MQRVLVSFAHSEAIEYSYAFDDDVDGFDSIDRLDAAVDPNAPG